MKKNSKRILAIIAVILLVLLAICTLVIALLDFPGKERLFMASAIAMVFLPILLWVYIWLYGIYNGKRTMASVWPEESDITDSVAESKNSSEVEKEENL